MLALWRWSQLLSLQCLQSSWPAFPVLGLRLPLSRTGERSFLIAQGPPKVHKSMVYKQ